mmetsp:Transcript_34782/g.90754  ORF Transcript_34782/g.90754 Transcript_34782/m.90754 type:complete len:474 (+) Transcript_34782:1082-2503(+)
MLVFQPQLVLARSKVHLWHPAPLPAPHVLRLPVHGFQTLRREQPVGMEHKPVDADSVTEQVSQAVAGAVEAGGHVGVRLVVFSSEEEGADDLDEHNDDVQEALPEPQPHARQRHGLLQRQRGVHRKLHRIPHRREQLPAPLGVRHGDRQIPPRKHALVLGRREGQRRGVRDKLGNPADDFLLDLHVALAARGLHQRDGVEQGVRVAGGRGVQLQGAAVGGGGAPVVVAPKAKPLLISLLIQSLPQCNGVLLPNHRLRHRHRAAPHDLRHLLPGPVLMLASQAPARGALAPPRSSGFCTARLGVRPVVPVGVAGSRGAPGHRRAPHVHHQPDLPGPPSCPVLVLAPTGRLGRAVRSSAGCGSSLRAGKRRVVRAGLAGGRGAARQRRQLSGCSTTWLLLLDAGLLELLENLVNEAPDCPFIKLPAFGDTGPQCISEGSPRLPCFVHHPRPPEFEALLRLRLRPVKQPLIALLAC